MSLSIKKTALAAAIGLSISASPVGAFPFWSFTGFGGSGALGGDNQWAPFDGRYVLKSGGMRFDTTSEEYPFYTFDNDVPANIWRIGTLTLEMELEGRAYDFPDKFPGRSPDIIDVDENGVEYVALGDFSFNMPFESVLFGEDGEDFVLYVPSYSQSQGTLRYDTDILFEDLDNNGELSNDLDDNGIADHLEDLNNDRILNQSEQGQDYLADIVIEDISVDGEREGDTVFFATPDCNELYFNPGRSTTAATACGDNVFQLKIPKDGSPANAFTPVGFTGESSGIPGVDDFDLGVAFDAIFGDSIPTGTISLFHAGLPCPPGDHGDDTAEAFYCDPIAANFPLGGIPVPGSTTLVYETYAEYVAGFNPPGHVAFINVQATPTNVPTPATGLLLGAGLAGLGFARRRAKARSAK